MVTFRQLRDARTDAVDSAAASARRISREFDGYATDTGRSRRSLAAGWQGRDATAADVRLAEHENGYRRDSHAFGRVDQVLGYFSDEIGLAKRTLDHGVDLARSIPGHVSDDGAIQVDWAAFGPRPSPEVIAYAKQRAQQAAGLIRQALARAGNADRQTAQALAALVPPGSAAATPAGTSIPQPGTDPRRVKEWWDGLTADQRHDLVTGQPARIGGLDGVPAVARDQANRIALGEERTLLTTRRDQLEARLAELRPTGHTSMYETGQMLAVRRELDGVDDRLANIGSLEHQLARTDLQGSRESLMLLDYDSAGDGRAVIAAGNPDLADSVVTLVPGTTADVPGIGGDVDRALWMQADATAADPGRRTAAIAWLGYDAPDKVFPNAMSADYYEDGADDLAAFQQGLRATHQGPPSINTLMGHSYGGSTIGYAATHYDLGVDNLVSVASAGSDGDAGDYIGIDADHVWATRASDDPIRFAAEVHGNDPIDADYGGRVFPADDGGHSGYWNAGNQAREHFADIITGHYDRVPEGAHDTGWNLPFLGQ